MNMKRHFALLALCWSVIMLIAMGYAMNREIEKKKGLAIIETRIAFDKDIIYRKWNAMHGGVYVPITKTTRPNQYLHIPERDITTPSGRKLTLVNPAYMTRQVHNLERQRLTDGAVGHITSLNPLNPVNVPYKWEKKALRQFENGQKEFHAFVDVDGRSYLRFMKPLFTEKACLKCHAIQGYKEGDLRGGISITVPTDKLNPFETKQLFINWAAYFVLWILGLAGLAVGTRKLDLQFKAMAYTEEELFSFKTALDNINDCILMFRPDTFKFFYVNHGATELFGYNVAEFLLMTPMALTVECDKKTCMDLLKPLLDDTETLLSFDTECVTKEGKTVLVDVKIQIVESGHRGKYLVAIMRDITRRKKMEEERERLNTELVHAQKLESVGRLAAGIAHEINTPVQYVGTNVDFLDEAFQDIMGLVEKYDELVEKAEKQQFENKLTEGIREAEEDADMGYLREEIPSAIEQSRDGIKRVTSIVRAMKEFSHPGGKEKALVDLNSIIETTVTVAKNEWKYVADMKLELDGSLPQVPCISDEMGQVILNIIVNAAHAIGAKLGENTEENKGIITIKTRKEESWVEMRISDTGTGIPEKARDKIFEPFFTTKEVGKGTGQGLAIARSCIVDKHNGQIDIESESGRGTTFIIRLPLDKA